MIETFLHNGFEWLTRQQDRLTMVPAVYIVGERSLSIRAVIGKTSQDVILQQEVGVGSSYFDFIIEASYLEGIEPNAGHYIQCDGKDFEIVNQADGRCYKFTDSTFTVYRIHTQLV